MGWFTSNQKTGTEVAIGAMRPVIGIVQNTYGIPAGFWTDPYVLGYMQFSIGHFSKLATNGKLSGDALGETLIDTLTALSNMNGLEIAKRMMQFQAEQNADLGKGADDAAILQYYGMGRLKDQANNEIVNRAKAIAERKGFSAAASPKAEISSMIFMITFISEIEKRFDLIGKST